MCDELSFWRASVVVTAVLVIVAFCTIFVAAVLVATIFHCFVFLVVLFVLHLFSPLEIG